MTSKIELAIYGTRGSGPRAEPEFMKYGGNTSSYALNLGNSVHLLDAGSGFTSAVANELDSTIDKAYLHITHCHPDHILGMGITGAMYFNNLDNGVYVTGNKGVRPALEKFFDGEDLWPIPLSALGGLNKSFVELQGGETLNYGTTEMATLTQYHPPMGLGGSIGYRFDIPTDDGRVVRVAYTTDMEFDFMPAPGGKNQAQPLAEKLKEDYVNFVRGADVLIADTQFTSEEYNKNLTFVRGWGHPYLEQVIDLATEAGVKTLLASHHNPNNNDVKMSSVEDYAIRYARDVGFMGDVAMARPGMCIKLS